MDRIRQLFLLLALVAPLHLVEQFAHGQNEFARLDRVVTAFSAWLGNAEQATAVLATAGGAAFLLLAYGLLAGGTSRLASTAVFAVLSLAESHHIVETFVQGTYSAGFFTATFAVALGVLLLVAIRAEHRLRVVLVAAALLSIAPAATAQEARPLTLDDAIAIALEHNRDVNAASHSLASANLAIATARSHRLPQFSVEALAGQSITEVGVDFPAGAFGTFDGIGPVPSVDTRVTSPRRPVMMAQATMTQPISQLFKLNLNIKATSVGRDIEQERQRLTMQTTAASVRKAYYALLQVDASLRAADAVLDASRALDGVVGERVVQRVALKGDGLQSQLRVAEALQERVTLRNRRAEREEQFNLLLGRDPHTPVVVVPVSIADDATVDLEVVIREAVDRRADVRAARLTVDQAELQQRVTNAGRIPDVSLAVSYMSFFNSDLLPKNLASVGVQVKWEPWDWGRRQREARQRGHDIEQARLSLRQIEDRVRIEVARSYRDIQQARGQVMLARASQEVVRDRVRVTTERIKVAAALPVDGLSANRELAESAAREQDALSGYWAARATYEQAIGEDVR